MGCRVRSHKSTFECDHAEVSCDHCGSDPSHLGSQSENPSHLGSQSENPSHLGSHKTFECDHSRIYDGFSDWDPIFIYIR